MENSTRHAPRNDCQTPFQITPNALFNLEWSNIAVREHKEVVEELSMTSCKISLYFNTFMDGVSDNRGIEGIHRIIVMPLSYLAPSY